MTQAPAHASRKSRSLEAAAEAKEFKLSKNGEETAEFKAAEEKRKLREAGKVAPMTESEFIQKNKLRSYADAIKDGDDPCKTGFGCRKKHVVGGICIDQVVTSYYHEGGAA